MASALLQSISQDDYEKARFLSKRKFENDLESDRNTVVKIMKHEIVKRMIANNRPIQYIMEDTGLTEEEITELKKKPL